MKKIGFVDYYISEWHANNYPAWLSQANDELGLDYELCYCWAMEEISPVDGVSTDEWCENMGVTRCATVEELCEKCDGILILAPSDPQTHLQLAKAVLPFGKPTYIDKTFAPDFYTAQEIFAIADKYNTPIFTSSALRYASELEKFESSQNITLLGGGSNFEEYAIHLVEMAVVLFKDGFKKVKVESQDVGRICRIAFNDGKLATILFAPGLPHAINGQLAENDYCFETVCSETFPSLLKDVLKLFEYKTIPFDSRQTLTVMSVRDALLKAQDNEGEWIEVNGEY